MKKELREKKLQELANNIYGEALLDYLEEKIKEMVDVRRIGTWEEVLGRKEAVVILDGLFHFLKSKRQQKPVQINNEFL